MNVISAAVLLMSNTTTATKMQRVFMYFDHFQKPQRRRNRGYVSAKRNLPFDKKKIRDSSVLDRLCQAYA